MMAVNNTIMKKLWLALLPIFMICLTIPNPAQANDASGLALQINAIPGLSAAASGSEVIVTGAVAGITQTLELNINSGVTVKWGAAYYSSTAMVAPLITLTGDGVFEVVQTTVGRFPELTNRGSGATIYATGTNASVIVSTGGVAAFGGNAILVTGQNATVTVRGTGRVFNESTTNVRPVIRMDNQSNNGLNVVVTDYGSVTVALGSGRGYAIETYGNVEVSGNADVQTRGDSYGRAINAIGPNSVVTVSGNSTVRAENGIAIDAGRSVTVSGGIVYNSGISDSYPAILIESGRGGTVFYVTISGTGQVEARGSGGTAIKSPGDVEVRGNARVSATTDGYAIHTTGAGNVTVSGGWVTATNSNAIRATNGTVTVNGGFVFAYGNAITGTGNVIHPASSFPSGATGTGVVVAWNANANRREYTEATPTLPSLRLLPRLGVEAPQDMELTTQTGLTADFSHCQ